MARRTAKTSKSPQLDRWGTLNTFVQQRLADLTDTSGSGTAGLLWLVLFTIANGKTGEAKYASGPRLERLTGLSRRTVWGAIQTLKKAELITEEKRPGQASSYMIAHQEAEQ